MAKKHYVIYVPGLGDHRMTGQSLLLHMLKFFGANAQVYMMYWNDGSPFEPKLEGLLAEIDRLKRLKFTVSLVGISAGASAALNAYVKRKDSIWRVVFICGKLGNFDNINPRYYKENPAFKGSINQAKISLNKLSDSDKAKMLSMQPIADGIVYVPDTKIDGVRNKRILAAGHVPSIAAAMLFYPRSIMKFIKNG